MPASMALRSLWCSWRPWRSLHSLRSLRLRFLQFWRRAGWAALLARLAFASALWAAGSAGAQTTAAVVVRVIDGDSLVLRPAGGGRPIEVRLADIDAPEICQLWGAESKKALVDLALAQTAVLRTSGRDGYGRTIGRVMVGDVDVGVWQVEQGHAWSAHGRNGRGPLMKQERMAKALNRGLWQGGGAVNPKDFRRSRGPCERGH